MLIDWVTARIPLDRLSPEARTAALHLGDRVCCYCPKTGVVRYETHRWESVRSDSHQISVRAGTDLWLQGSPARIIGNGCAVFGSGPSASLDLIGCVQRMISFVGHQLGVSLPPVTDTWLVSRVDVTGNLALDSLAEVRTALSVLRNVEGGRYRVSQQAGDTVYWSHLSKLRSGKAYAKGPHLRYLMKNPKYEGHQYQPHEIALADNLLRLELKLGREWFARNPWKTATPAALNAEWNRYFLRMIGGVEVEADNDLQERIIAAAKTEGQGRAAYGCWVMIQNEGWERARQFFSKTTWYRNLKILRSAGLGDADISAGKVVPLRRRFMEARLITDWSQIAA
mgnify:FL=1|tara:strand:+ start:91421 stop:92440 length:1020 start_codon:yes stop_codon:yes gene_type:complete